MAHAKMEVDKIICIVRNPIDVFPSAASLIVTGSHTQVPDRPFNSFSIWSGLVNWFADNWKKYHDRVRA